jgi:hypothetical protein
MKKMIKAFQIGLLSTFCAVSTTLAQVSLPLPAIHPKVFTLVECWLSDTAWPLVTEINLDAVRENRNQFDSDGVTTNGEWTFGDELKTNRKRRFDLKIRKSRKERNKLNFLIS